MTPIPVEFSSSYIKSIKELKRKNRSDMLIKVSRIIEELRVHRVGSKYRNHKLSGSEYSELHVDHDLLLVYRYKTNETLEILYLKDLTNHKNLDRSIRSCCMKNKKVVYSSKQAVVAETEDERFDREWEERFGPLDRTTTMTPDEFDNWMDEVIRFAESHTN